MERRADLVILTGTSHPTLARLIGERLGVPVLDNAVVKQNSANETDVQINTSLRGKSVFIVQTGTKNVNNDIMELLILIYACKTSCASRIVGVLPYLPYCKQSRTRKRGSIVTKLLADMLLKAGMNHMITCDLHLKEIQGFFGFPVENLRASPYLLQYINETFHKGYMVEIGKATSVSTTYVGPSLSGLSNKIPFESGVVVARQPSAVQRASGYAERLRIGLAVVHGSEMRLPDSEQHDGRSSPLPEDAERALAASTTGSGNILTLVGDVKDKTAFIVDDIIDNLESFCEVADLLKQNGAKKCVVMAVHGLLSSDQSAIDHHNIDEVIVTNSVPHDPNDNMNGKLRIVDISPIISEAIRRIHHNESMSYLFKNIPTGD